MGRIIAIASQKGGVGKTTTAVNMSFSLSLSSKNILLVDLDPQGNGTSGLGVARPAADRPAFPVEGGYLTAALHGQPLGPHVQRTSFPNLSVLPSSAELSQLSLIQEVERRGMGAFRKAARDIAAGFDAVFVDCPPSLAGLPHMALSVSDWVLIPVQCEYYAMEGLSQIMPIIYDVQKGNNKELRVIGLLLTMFSEELELSHDVLREVKGYFPDAVFDTVIPRDVVLAEAASHGLPAFEYAPLSRGAWSYVELAKELIRHG